ncbi:TIGR03084 family metal-binding protein [Lentzea sp. DG1S-22]|uniref:TIGR03084 family metal-binding protein n=1 Tax=Lentzea sp. DG1S-22 TaxID=3108822 RepID=UPI002E78811B|nr:TIGR03084 family metal-binding protein [Lentzea sp. DG1S-22]WVH82897.1 TIGR03084 family metal-binding protein [Lentzea sp. DG1S-22]
MTEENVYLALKAEGEEVDRMVASLTESQWSLPTPAPGWTIAHQIAHLTSTTRMAGLAASDPAAFATLVAGIGADFDGAVAGALAPFLSLGPRKLLERWRAERQAAGSALSSVPDGQLVPWLVNPLPAPVLAAGGMMELFAHGQDIADTLGIRREPTGRLKHLCGFGFHTMTFGYLARGLTPPQKPFRFELTGPSGELWTFGPQDASQRISGPALDFCLLVARRRHHADLAVVAEGEEALGWLEVAQAYRGPAGAGREAGQFSSLPA